MLIIWLLLVDNEMMLLLIVSIIAYLIGAIPSGWLLARYVGIDDITKHGSGNIGATNVARVAGIKYFFIVFFLDCIKAYIFLQLLIQFQLPDFVLLSSSIALLIGNGFSCFLQGKGGKGIATAIGILLALNGIILYGVLLIWLCAVLLTKNVGFASVMGLISLPFVTLFYNGINPSMIMLSFFISSWGLWRHEKNIRSFINGYKAVS